MTLPAELLHRAGQLGLRLEARGDKLAVIPAKLCPPEFADALRQHKGEMLAMLETRLTGLPPDCVPWVHIARQILAGEFDTGDGSTLESLRIGVRNIHHPLCQSAKDYLDALTKHRKKLTL